MKLPNGPRLPSLLQTLYIIAQPTRFLDRCAQRYGDTFTLRVLGVGSPPVVFCGSPQAIQDIFTTQADRFELGKVTHVFRPLTGPRSLIMQDGRRHQRLRQLLMPPLHGERLHSYGQLICNITDDVLSPWQSGQPLHIREWMSEISLQVILRVVFGLDPGPRYEELRVLLHTLLEAVTSPLYSVQFFLPPLQLNVGPKSPWGHFLKLRQRIDDLVYAEIRDRREQFDPDRIDVLNLLISARDEAGEALTDEELRDQLMTLLLLGHETTASSLTWAFYWLYRQPQTLSRLLQELDVGPETSPLEVAQLPYLTAVCKEALRVYPIALISQPRWVKESVRLEGYDLDPGTVVVPCIYLAHRRSQTYAEPEQFQPERFLDYKPSPYEYLPFGGGSRSCIGMALSLFEMKLVLAQVLRHYALDVVADRVFQRPVQPVRRGITFVPPEDFRLRVIDRRAQPRSLVPF